MSEIVIENIGPIVRAVIPAPEDGGLVELRGTHGVGKSTAVAAVQAAMREDGKLPLRDGADRGRVECGGVVIRVTPARTQHGGELLVDSIEGRFSLRDLIDPGIADPQRADAARIKALVELSGAKADASLFAEIAPEPIRAKADDLVGLAAAAKREWEQVARDAETAQAVALDKGKRQAPPEDAIVVGAVDPATLAARQREAAAKLVELETSDRIAREAAATHQDVAARLATIDVPGLERGLHEAVDEQQRRLDEADRRVQAAAKLRAELDAAERAMREAAHAASEAVRDAKAAAKSLDDARGLQAALQASVPPRVDPTTIEAARQSVQQAEAAIASNAEIVRNVEQMQKAAEHFATADAHGARAKKYREACGKIDDVLSRVVAGMGCPLRVTDGRLVIDSTERSGGVEKFGELSHGERTLAAIDVALGVIQPGGVLVIDQETYGGLHDSDRRDIAIKAAARGVLVLAAVITEDSDLRAVVL